MSSPLFPVIEMIQSIVDQQYHERFETNYQNAPNDQKSSDVSMVDMQPFTC